MNILRFSGLLLATFVAGSGGVTTTPEIFPLASPYEVCNPFGEVDYGVTTCAEYFDSFDGRNCNYNLLNHNICDGNNPDESVYIQIRDLCPVECANVDYVEDSLDDSIAYPIDAVDEEDAHRRRLVTHSWRTNGGWHSAILDGVVAYMYEHHNGRGHCWFAGATRCCDTVGWVGFGAGEYIEIGGGRKLGLGFSNNCDGDCKESEGSFHGTSQDNTISSVSVGERRIFVLYENKHSFWGWLSNPHVINSRRECSCGITHENLSSSKNDKASAYYSSIYPDDRCYACVDGEIQIDYLL